MWLQYGDLLQILINERIDRDTPDALADQMNPALDRTFVAHFDDVRRRNEAMLFRNLPPRARGSLSSALADIKVSLEPLIAALR